MLFRATFVLGLTAVLAGAQLRVPPAAPDPAAVALREGVEAFNEADYPRAAQEFDRARKLNPSDLKAQLYFGHAEMKQYTPGLDSPENYLHADLALEAIQDVADREPSNKLALKLLASLTYDMKRYAEAGDAHRRLVELEPNDRDSHYTIGVIAWNRSFKPRMELRKELGMKAEQPGPIVDAHRRGLLALQTKLVVREGLAHLERALEIDPEYADTMAYASLLERELADLSETQIEYDQLMRKAQEWVKRAMALKKEQAEAQR